MEKTKGCERVLKYQLQSQKQVIWENLIFKNNKTFKAKVKLKLREEMEVLGTVDFSQIHFHRLKGFLAR